MIKATVKMISAVMVAGLLASGVYAAPITLNETQLDAVAAGGQMRGPVWGDNTWQRPDSRDLCDGRHHLAGTGPPVESFG